MAGKGNASPINTPRRFHVTFSRLLTALFLATLLCLPTQAEKSPRPTPLAELWFQTSAEYRAVCHQTYNLAWMQIQNWKPLMTTKADGRAYLIGSDKPCAVILDLDETVIDNCGFQAFQYKSGQPYSPKLWSSWVEFQGRTPAAARTVPGAAKFLRKLQATGVTPLYVSNRSVGDEPSTIKVLEAAGINVEGMDSRLFLHLPKLQENERAQTVASQAGLSLDSPEGKALLKGEGSKEARRRLLRQKYDVVAYFGDVLGDFEPFVEMADNTRLRFEQRQQTADRHADRWGSSWFVLPNPIYGSWKRAVSKDELDNALSDFGFSDYLDGR